MNRSVSARSGTISLDQATAARISGVHLASNVACAQRAAIGFDTTTPCCSVYRMRHIVSTAYER